MNIFDQDQEESPNQGNTHVRLIVSIIQKKTKTKSKTHIFSCDSEGIKQIIQSRGDTSSFHFLFKKIVDVEQNQLIKAKLCEIQPFRNLLELLDEDQTNQFLSSISHEKFQQFDTVYKQNELSRKYYLVLSGTLIALKNKDSVVGYEKVSSKKSRIFELDGQVFNLNDPISTVEQINSNKNILRILQPGRSCFGDIELFLNVERISTIIAATDAQVISITSRVFEKVFLDHFKAQWQPILKFFSEIPFFSSMKIEEYIGIIVELKYFNLSASKHVYQEGDSADQIYFIKYGEIQLEKKIEIINSDTQTTPFVSYSSNQFFGYMEIILNISRNSSARVVSPKAGLFKINKKKFFDNLANFKAFNELKQQAQVLFDSHQERFSKIQKEGEKQEKKVDEQKISQSTNISSINSSIFHKIGNLSSHKEFAQYKLIGQVAEEGSHRVRQAFSFRQGVTVNNNSNQKNKKIIFRKNHSFQIQGLRGVGQNLEEQNFYFEISQKDSVRFEKIPNYIQSQENLSKISIQNEIDQEIPQIQRKQRVQRDNIVIKLLKQKAFNSKNPKVELQKIEQAFEWATKNVLMKRNKLQRYVQLKQNKSRQDVKLLQVLNVQQVLQRNKSNTSLPPLEQTISRRNLDH